MSIPEFIGLIRRRIVLILAVAGALVAVVTVWSLLSPTIYKAKAGMTVFLVTEESSGVASVPSDLLDSYPEYAARQMRAEVAEELGIATLAGDVVEVIHPPKSNLLEVFAQSRNPELAADIANEVARRLEDEIETTSALPGQNAKPRINATIYDPATIPTDPASPQTLRNIILAIFAGLIAGIAAAIVREILDTRLRDPSAVRDLLDLPVLATIDSDRQLKDRSLLLEQSDLDQEEIAQDRLIEMWSRSRVAEEFRQLRANLQFFDFDGGPRSIMVTSCKPGEGKTTTAGNLAITMALAGESVVLVDCDLRRPTVAKSLHVQSETGLTDVLIGRADLDDSIVSGRRLNILTAGASPPNPSELLGSQAMADLLAQLHERFNVVVIDTPPTLPFADPAVLAPLCGATLMVVRMNYTSVAELERGVTTLRGVQARLCGSVVNMIDSRSAGRGYGGYYYYSYRGEDVDPDLAASGLDMLRPRTPANGNGGNGYANGGATPANGAAGPRRPASRAHKPPPSSQS